MIPAGWRVYQGTLPFVIAYLPDWTVDETQISNNLVYFSSRRWPIRWFVVIATTATPEDCRPDVLRDR
ncbi:MAG: hypothetical protein U0841_18985 [Chloroflexia bacterium]